MLDREYPDPGALQRLRVHVPDRPGVLAGITQALGAERINIEDFELHHVSPERGGDLTVLVEGEGEAQRAAAPARVAGLHASSSRRCSMRVEPAAALDGHLAVPGDKSISHRSLLLGAVSRRRDARARLRPLGRHESTLAAVRALGAQVDEHGPDELTRARRRVARPRTRARSTAATPARSRA